MYDLLSISRIELESRADMLASAHSTTEPYALVVGVGLSYYINQIKFGLWILFRT